MRKKRDRARESATVNLYLDTRRKKDNGLFPVRIRVYDRTTKKTRLYSTDFDLSEKDFSRIFFPEARSRLRNEEKQIREGLETIKSFYEEKARDLRTFTFDGLEKAISTKPGEQTNVFFHYDCYIAELLRYNQFSTASNYQLSAKSLKAYLQARRINNTGILFFQDVTVRFLNDFEHWMIKEQGRSSTTVGMYLRALRTVFNKAIDAEVIDQEIYPFGSRKYEIPSSTNVKKSLNTQELNTLFKAVPSTPEQEIARDYWFFSFSCNGMNLKDIINLRWENIHDDQIVFIREKTKRTKKTNIKPIQVPLTAFARDFIKKYGNVRAGKGLVFPVLDEQMPEEEMHRKKQNFIRYINQHLKKLAIDNGLPKDISTYWARHSFSTAAIRKNASMEYVSEALGHSDLRTTKNYFSGFEDKTKQEILEGIT